MELAVLHPVNVHPAGAVVGVWSGLVKACRELLFTARALMKKTDAFGIENSSCIEEFCAADVRLFQVVKIFEATPLAVLKEEGLETGFDEGNIAASAFFPSLLSISLAGDLCHVFCPEV